MLPDFLLPHHAVDTRKPLFRHMWSHLRVIHSEVQLRRVNRIILIGIPLITLLWWFIERQNLNFYIMQSDISSRLINTLSFIALCAMLCLSLYSIPTILGKFHAQLHSAYWDILCLTPQYNSALLMSHDAIAQLRLWPFTVIEVGLRIALTLLVTLNTFYDHYQNLDDKSAFLSSTLSNTLLWIAGAGLFWVAVAFILEPIIRARLIVSLHLIIAGYVSHAPLTVCAGFFAMLLIHGLQAVFLACIWLMVVDFTRREMGGSAIIFCLIPLTIFAAILFWALYAWLRKSALTITYHAVFHTD